MRSVPLLSRLALVLFVAAFVVAAPAHGRPAEPNEKDPALEHYKEGVRQYKAKNWSAAVEAYEKSLALGGEASTLFELAQAHQRLGNDEKALVNLRLFLRLSPGSPLRFLVKKQIAQLGARLAKQQENGGDSPAPAASAATVEEKPTVEKPPAENNPAVVESSVEKVAPQRQPVAVPEPASAPVSATVPATPPVVAVASVEKPESPHAAPATVEQPASAKTESPAPPAATIVAPAVEAQSSSQAPAPTQRGHDAFEIAAEVITIAGGALLGAGIGLAVWARQTAGENDFASSPNPDVQAAANHQSAAAAGVSVAGTVTMVVGVGMIWKHYRRGLEKHEATKAVTIIPAIAPTSGGATATLSFTF